MEGARNREGRKGWEIARKGPRLAVFRVSRMPTSSVYFQVAGVSNETHEIGTVD
jgi:hypothetical protein